MKILGFLSPLSLQQSKLKDFLMCSGRLRNVCAVHQGVCSTPWNISILGDIIGYTGGHEYSGVLSAMGGYHGECGDIMSTAGGVQYTGGYHDECGGIS